MTDIKEGNDQLYFSSSLPPVTYSCGSCGYQLNLNSDNRNTSVISAKYGKIIKRGIMTFFCIDETRFDKVEKLRFVPYFSSKSWWGFCRRTTKLLCRKCGTHIGDAYTESCASPRPRTALAWDGMSNRRVYDVKMRALQPSYTQHELCFT